MNSFFSTSFSNHLCQMRHNTVLSVLAGYWGNWAVVTFKRKCMGPTRLHASIKSWSSTLLPSHWQIKARDPHLTKSQLHSDSVFNPGPCTAGSRGVKSPKTSKHLLQCLHRPNKHSSSLLQSPSCPDIHLDNQLHSPPNPSSLS